MRDAISLRCRAGLYGIAQPLLPFGQVSVVVRKLVQVCKRDLTSQYRVVVGYVGSRIYRAMLELNFEVPFELLDIEFALIDTELFADPPGFFGSKTLGLSSCPRFAKRVSENSSEYSEVCLYHITHFCRACLSVNVRN